MEKASFEFNKESGSSREKMQPADRDKHDLMNKARETKKLTYNANYERDRPQRIAEEEKALTQTNELNQNMPRPPWAPPPEFLTADKIREKAEKTVDNAHIKRGDELAARHKITTDDHIKQALGQPVDNSDAAYEARKAAYMQRAQQRRDREQGRNRADR